MIEAARNWLAESGLSDVQAEWAVLVAKVVGVAALAWFANFLSKKIIVRALGRVVQKTKTEWDDVVRQKQVFNRLSHLSPALVIWALAPSVFGLEADLTSFARRAAEVYMLVVGLLVVNGLLDSAHEIYRRHDLSRRVPIRGYVQIAKILLAIAVLIVGLSLTLGRSPWVFLSGLGAMTALILLIFKDTILGFVAGILLNVNDMVRPGDWIQMPKYGADGDVMDVTLTTVKVRNWDKTISTVPTYGLISDSFKNWRGMSESGGRRIKRALYIDVNSIRFCTPELIERLSRIQLLRPYIEAKLVELDKHNHEQGIDDTTLVNGRRMTNIGTFRAYLVAYLRSHPMIHQEMTFLVRHLEPTERGLPVEIYVFSKDQRWPQYEAIQADIFDHIFAVLPEFELRPFQNPTGADIAALASRSDPVANRFA